MTREDWMQLIEEMMVGMLEDMPPDRAAYLIAWNDALTCYHGVQTGLLTMEQALAIRDGIPPGGVPPAKE